MRSACEYRSVYSRMYPAENTLVDVADELGGAPRIATRPQRRQRSDRARHDPAIAGFTRIEDRGTGQRASLVLTMERNQIGRQVGLRCAPEAECSCGPSCWRAAPRAAAAALSVSPADELGLGKVRHRDPQHSLVAKFTRRFEHLERGPAAFRESTASFQATTPMEPNARATSRRSPYTLLSSSARRRSSSASAYRPSLSCAIPRWRSERATPARSPSSS